MIRVGTRYRVDSIEALYMDDEKLVAVDALTNKTEVLFEDGTNFGLVGLDSGMVNKHNDNTKEINEAIRDVYPYVILYHTEREYVNIKNIIYVSENTGVALLRTTLDRINPEVLHFQALDTEEQFGLVQQEMKEILLYGTGVFIE